MPAGPVGTSSRRAIASSVHSASRSRGPRPRYISAVIPDRPIDFDALMADVRERVREKREKGIYGPDVEALLRVPLPGGRRIFSADLQDPLASLPEALRQEAANAPRGRKLTVGR